MSRMKDANLPCYMCNGTGLYPYSGSQFAHKGPSYTQWAPCQLCYGTGKVYEDE